MCDTNPLQSHSLQSKSLQSKSLQSQSDITISLDNKQHMQQVRNLWETVFVEDSARYLDFYFQFVYPQNVVVLAKMGDTVVGMLHMNPYELVGATTYYIVGVATHADYRGLGIMRKMMEFSIEFAKSMKINDLILLPVDERFYTSFGFKFVSKQYNTHIQTAVYQQAFKHHRTDSMVDSMKHKPMLEIISSCESFVQQMLDLKLREGGIASYKPFEPLQTEKYLHQLYEEMLSESGKIASVDGHIILYYDEEILEIRVIYVDSKKPIDNLVDWIVAIANKREVIFHEVNIPQIAQQFTYHQQNTYDVRPYMMILSNLCCVNNESIQKDNYFNEVV